MKHPLNLLADTLPVLVLPRGSRAYLESLHPQAAKPQALKPMCATARALPQG
jgi:hypothetical protein